MALRYVTDIDGSFSRGVKNVLTGKSGCHISYRQLTLSLRNSKLKIKTSIFISTQDLLF